MYWHVVERFGQISDADVRDAWVVPLRIDSRRNVRVLHAVFQVLAVRFTRLFPHRPDCLVHLGEWIAMVLNHVVEGPKI